MSPNLRRLSLVVFLLAAAAACDSSSAVKEPAPDAAAPPPPPNNPPPGDGGAMPDGSDCFMNPTTHYEIINACTNAQKVEKTVNLPLLYPDGGLPPTP
jgi:hypothetical protein